MRTKIMRIQSNVIYKLKLNKNFLLKRSKIPLKAYCISISIEVKSKLENISENNVTLSPVFLNSTVAKRIATLPSYVAIQD